MTVDTARPNQWRGGKAPEAVLHTKFSEFWNCKRDPCRWGKKCPHKVNSKGQSLFAAGNSCPSQLCFEFNYSNPVFCLFIYMSEFYSHNSAMKCSKVSVLTVTSVQVKTIQPTVISQIDTIQLSEFPINLWYLLTAWYAPDYCDSAVGGHPLDLLAFPAVHSPLPKCSLEDPGTPLRPREKRKDKVF